MRQKIFWLTACIIFAVFLKAGLSIISFSNAYSYYGSKSSEVFTIQTKLKNWGYYNGGVDSIYGYQTYMAVKTFQEKNGLDVDGICGNATLAALGINTKATNTTNTTSTNTGTTVSRGGYDRNEDLLAHLIHGEARGEPYIGQVAVGAVVLNRVTDGRFPRTVAGVIYQNGAFDAVKDGQINLPPSSSCQKAARDALNGWDPSNGSVYYYNPKTATSSWILTRVIIAEIGKHVFAK